eukprot:XP_014033869.1 PREDICTED: inactive phospholipase C-like protein 2 isoform X2 [Salmo salar]
MKPSPGNGVNLQTHREDLVSNGGCGMSDTVTAVQTDTGPGSPMTDKPGAGGDTDAKGIPRRSSIIKSGSRAGRERKKTVSFSSSLSERKISSAADCISAMVRGTELRKVRSNSRVYQRYYLLESGLQALRWEPSKKESDKARIAVSSVREVRTGRNTETFRTNGIYDQISEDCAFSIIYGETYEALDLVANSAEVANVWVTGLRYLILYGKHAMDMIASSEDSLRLVWLAEMFSSKVVSNGQGGREEGISLRSAIGLIKSVNPGVRSGKVERRFKELHRIKERTSGARTTGVGTDVGAVAGPEAMVGTSVVAGAGTGSGDGIEMGKGDGAGTRTEVVCEGDGAGTRTEVVGEGDGAGTRTEVVGKGDGAGTRTEVVGKGDGAGTRTEVVGKGHGAGTRTEVVGKGDGAGTRTEVVGKGHGAGTRTEVVGKGDGAGTRTEVVGKGDGAGTRTEVVGKGDGAGTRTEVVGKGDGAGTRTEVVGKGDGAGTRTEVVGKGDGAGTRTEVVGKGDGAGTRTEVVGKGDGAGTRTEVVGKGDGAGTRTEVVGKGDGAGTRTEVVGKGDGAGTRTEVVGKGDGAGTRTEVVGKGDGAGTRTEVVGKGNTDNRKGEIEDMVTKEEFIEVFHELCTRPEIYFLLVQFSSNKEFLDTKDLMKFLEAEQGVAQVTEDTSLELIQSHEPSEEGRRQGCLSLDGFTSYLTSLECHLFDPEHSQVCQDMSQPLSHYYINSSHNTYLIEDQFRGPTDITGYIRALKMGCRCVEVDVWDGPDDEPVVYTGYTLTSPVLFRCVLDVIGCFSFAASECPLILCLENHCSPRQQRVMLQHLRRILGERLYTEPLREGEGYLPSPHALRGKILLKGQKLEEGCGETEGDVTDEDEGAEMCQRMKAGNSEGGGGEGGQKGGGGGVTSSVKTLTPAPPSKRFQLLKELSDLVTLCKSVRFTDFQKSFSTQKPWEFCSFNETLAVRCASECPGDFVNYNKRFLSRVYPSAMRIDSSNMNPQDLWKCGCQIVAMNYQTPGLMMDLNIAWFRQNGNCGYVLRPAIMRQEVSYFSANTRESVPGVSPQLLHVKVISGQNLPRPSGSGAKGDVVDPYVYVEIHGIPADCAERRTRTVVENGDNPIFDESFEFQINLPELAMVRFVVLDDEFIGDEFIGQYTIPLECLQPGYRHVPLHSLTGEDLPYARLFVHVALTNRRGGGKSHKRGLSVRKARRGREYAALRDLGVKALDDVFKMAAPSLKEATDMRENMQNSVAVFRDLCGVSAVANLMQCVLALGSRVAGADGAPLLLFELKEQYPSMESQGPLPDVLRRVVSTYETMIQASRAVIELSDGVYDRILQIQTTAMEFHEKLKPMAVKEGLKGRKVTRAVESFSWNITILKGQADLLKRAKTEVQENIKQVHYAALTSNLSKGGTGETTHTRRSLDAPPSVSGTAPARSFP